MEILRGLEVDGLAGACELIGGRAGNLFCRKRRRHLLHVAVKTRGDVADLFERQRRMSLLAGRVTVGIVGVGREAEANGAGSNFFRPMRNIAPGA